MCGRFSNAQPVYQYTATVRRQLHDRDDDHGAAGGHENDAGSSSTLNQGKDASDGSKSSSTGTSDSFLIHTSLSEEDYYPTHNVSPSSRVPVVRLEKAVPLPLDGHVGESNTPSKNALTIECMRWGLLPSYTTSIPHGVDALRTINARDDSIMSGQGMWTPLLKKGKRCIIFCQGFFEWQKKQDGTRVAHFVGMLNEGSGRVDIKGKHRALMPMAGLYERCFIDEKEVMSFTVITTESNKQLNFLVSEKVFILSKTRA
jgi:putative SOS response-associated peptidase YedK